MSDSRRDAADARRIVKVQTGGLDRDKTKRIREVLKGAFDRGRRVGREEREKELPNASVRGSLLKVAVTVLKGMEAQVSVIPNSGHAVRAFREAWSVLEDAEKQEERLPPTRSEDLSATDAEVNRISETLDGPAKKKPAKKSAKKVKA